MKVRNAKISDAESISALISNYAEHDKMLFRSLADIYENLQSFFVAENEAGIVGCCALEIIWSDLAEIKSLAVAESSIGSGVGKMLITAATEKAQQIGLPRIFALTLTPEFFQKADFETIEKEALPMKVWKDCAKCPKQQNCDETAMIKTLTRDSK